MVNISKDTLWKAIIEDLFEDFLNFFFTDYIHLINLERGFEFLDKELAKLFPESENKPRHADKLVKVFLKNEEEQWILIHVEVQGYVDRHFDERMFTYFYRIYDRYQQSVTALAIYLDSNEKYHYREFFRYCFQTQLSYKFNTYVLQDHSPSELRLNDNPFALIMESAWQGMLAFPKGEFKLADLKLDLFRRMLAKGFSKEKIRKIGNFMLHYASFNDERELFKFEESLNIILPKRRAMGIEEAILHEVEQRGIKKGREEGREEGLRLAITSMLQQGYEAEFIANALNLPLEMVLSVKKELPQ